MTYKATNASPSSSSITGLQRESRKAINLFLGLGLVLVVLWTISPLKWRLEQRRELVSLERQLDRVRQRNAELTDNNQRLKTDSDYIKQVIRQQLGLYEANEEAYIVLANKGEPRVRPSRRSEAGPSWWKQIETVLSRLLPHP